MQYCSTCALRHAAFYSNLRSMPSVSLHRWLVRVCQPRVLRTVCENCSATTVAMRSLPNHRNTPTTPRNGNVNQSHIVSRPVGDWGA